MTITVQLLVGTRCPGALNGRTTIGDIYTYDLYVNH